MTQLAASFILDSNRVGSSESLSTASSSCGDVSAIVSPNSMTGNDLTDATGQQLLCVVCGDTRYNALEHYGGNTISVTGGRFG